MKVIIKEPGETVGHIEKIENKLETLQGIVGGYIQAIPCGTALIILNEEGKHMGLPANILYGSYIKDVLVGTIIVCGQQGDEFSDVPFGIETWKTFLDIWGN